MNRTTVYERNTRETQIKGSLNLDGSGEFNIDTPIGFFSHLLESFCRHGLFDLHLTAAGDLQVDQHHLIEDCGIVLGQLFDRTLADRRAINRAGYFVYPMDEALAVVAVDIGGRPFLQYDVTFKRRLCGDMDTDLVEDFFIAFASNLKANIVVRMPYGRNDHHKMEAIFKAWGKAMQTACNLNPRLSGRVLSTKGVI